MNPINAETSEMWTRTGHDLDTVDFRHLQAFRAVYEERDFTAAGHRLSSNRKCVMRMVQNLERAFADRLFEEVPNGLLVAGDFATRLFNDLRSLERTRGRLRDHVNGVHEKGRLLRVGSSPAMFRTCGFRNLFRALQSMDGIRVGYVPIDFQNAGKAMMSGHCDIFVGPWTGPPARFVTRKVGLVPYRLYRSLAGGGAPAAIAAMTSVVPLDGCLPVGSDGAGRVEMISVDQWLFWLDHPEEFPTGMGMHAPEARVDSEFWSVEPESTLAPAGMDMNISFLLNHAYEFLPSLVSNLQLPNPR